MGKIMRGRNGGEIRRVSLEEGEKKGSIYKPSHSLLNNQQLKTRLCTPTG